MNLLQKRYERINYQENAAERKHLMVNLNAGYFKKSSGDLIQFPGSAKAQIIVYALSALFFLTGLFFVFF